MMTYEEIETYVRTMPPEVLRELLEDHVVLDEEGHYILLREQFAKTMMRIARNPDATKDCRTRAFRCAKQYLTGFDSAGEV
jgi:hypothetical protein